MVIEEIGISDRDDVLPLAVPAEGASSQDASFEPREGDGPGPARIFEIPVRTLDGCFEDEKRG